MLAQMLRRTLEFVRVHHQLAIHHRTRRRNDRMRHRIILHDIPHPITRNYQKQIIPPHIILTNLRLGRNERLERRIPNGPRHRQEPFHSPPPPINNPPPEIRNSPRLIGHTRFMIPTEPHNRPIAPYHNRPRVPRIRTHNPAAPHQRDTTGRRAIGVARARHKIVIEGRVRVLQGQTQVVGVGTVLAEKGGDPIGTKLTRVFAAVAVKDAEKGEGEGNALGVAVAVGDFDDVGFLGNGADFDLDRVQVFDNVTVGGK